MSGVAAAVIVVVAISVALTHLGSGSSSTDAGPAFSTSTGPHSAKAGAESSGALPMIPAFGAVPDQAALTSVLQARARLLGPAFIPGASGAVSAPTSGTPLGCGAQARAAAHQPAGTSAQLTGSVDYQHQPAVVYAFATTGGGYYAVVLTTPGCRTLSTFAFTG